MQQLIMENLMSEVEIIAPPRPEVDYQMKIEASRAVQKKLESYGYDSEYLTEEALEEIAEEYSVGDDGYSMGKKLDDAGWIEMDMQMCECLDAMDGTVRNLKSKAIEKWVEEYNIKPTIDNGTEIKWRFKSWIVDGFDEKRATYLCKEVGKDRTGRTLIPYEEAKLKE